MYTYQLVIEVMSYDQNFLIGPEDNHEIEEIKLEMKNELIQETYEKNCKDFDISAFEDDMKELDQVAMNLNFNSQNCTNAM